NYKNDYQPLIEKSGGKTTYTFSFENTNAIPEDEDLMPPLQDVLGAIYMSSIKDWKDIADWYRELDNKSIVDASEITLKAIALVKGKDSQKDKARAILEYLQDEFRYVPLNFGDNTIAPHGTNEILKSKYGDSKDISLLAKQMLRIVGIDSNICLFSGEFAGNPQVGLPSPSVFSSVILQVTVDGQSYYVDPQLKGFDFGHYPSSYDNAYVMVIDDNSYKFDHLPVSDKEEHALVSQADVMLSADGAAEYKVHVKLPLETSQNFRTSWKVSNEEDKNKFFANLEQSFSKGGKMVTREVIGVDDRYAPIEFDLKYQAPKAYPIVNDMILIKEEDQSDMPEFVGATRKNPIFVPNNSLIRNTNTYYLPEGYKINSAPASYSLSIDSLDVAVNYSQKDNTIKVDSSYITKRCSIPIERYNQVKDFRKELSKKNDQYIVLKTASDLSNDAKKFMNN
ncbi:MAG: transglutaminase domain-containing protein, partial [Candidatus Omnitrophica bacterium]|nr:transglutaminase domain-containing protein [Candidatus Omnitrophota bacterium]